VTLSSSYPSQSSCSPAVLADPYRPFRRLKRVVRTSRLCRSSVEPVAVPPPGAWVGGGFRPCAQNGFEWEPNTPSPSYRSMAVAVNAVRTANRPGPHRVGREATSIPGYAEVRMSAPKQLLLSDRTPAECCGPLSCFTNTNDLRLIADLIFVTVFHRSNRPVAPCLNSSHCGWALLRE